MAILLLGDAGCSVGLVTGPLARVMMNVSGHGALVLSDWHVRSLKIVDINLVLNSLSTMGSDILCLGIFQRFIGLDCEVLSLDFLFEFLTLNVAEG